jgi:hypothetical protein
VLTELLQRLRLASTRIAAELGTAVSTVGAVLAAWFETSVSPGARGGERPSDLPLDCPEPEAIERHGGD